MRFPPLDIASRYRRRSGSVLIIVLWVSFGLVALALYFAHAMSLEMRAAENRTSSLQAEQAIAGVARYITNVLGRLTEPGQIPVLTTYRTEAVPVGDATFWLIGRSDKQTGTMSDYPAFGLVDESSKLNLNAATQAMLEALPRMTPELAAALIDWRDANDEVTQGGAESESYLRRDPPYRCKNTNYESVAEVRLVTGAELDLLFGDDANQNGLLDSNENDGDNSTPSDNRDGRLDPGLFEYLTVYTQHPATGTNVSDPQQLASLLQSKFSADRANEILARIQGGVPSVFEFYIRSGITREEFVQIEPYLMGTNTLGLVNVNTATEAVLACIPGIGPEFASTLVSYRRMNPDQLNSMAWVKDAMEWSESSQRQAGPWLTGRTFQFTADIAAVGNHGRGFRRVKMVFDTSDGTPRIRYRQDLTPLGWALGPRVRESLQLARDIR